MQIDTAHARLRGEGDEGRFQFVHLARAQSEFFLCQHDNAAAFRRFVGERASCAACSQVLFGSTPGAG